MEPVDVNRDMREHGMDLTAEHPDADGRRVSVLQRPLLIRMIQDAYGARVADTEPRTWGFRAFRVEKALGNASRLPDGSGGLQVIKPPPRGVRLDRLCKRHSFRVGPTYNLNHVAVPREEAACALPAPLRVCSHVTSAWNARLRATPADFTP